MHARMKYFDIQLYFIRNTIEEKKVTYDYLSTDQMVADILTKPLKGPKTQVSTKKLGLY